MQHPGGGNHRKSSYDLGHSQSVGGVAQGLVVAVVHVGLDVVVGRVVVGLLHATFRVAALQHVAGSACRRSLEGIKLIIIRHTTEKLNALHIFLLIS